jgi:hypothetical protein
MNAPHDCLSFVPVHCWLPTKRMSEEPFVVGFYCITNHLICFIQLYVIALSTKISIEDREEQEFEFDPKSSAHDNFIPVNPRIFRLVIPQRPEMVHILT